MKKNAVTVKEVIEVIRLLGSALGLVEETQESSLENFVGKFSSMSLEEANIIVETVIIAENYIEKFADKALMEMHLMFPYRTKEDVREKLIRTESIRVAVALLIVAKNDPDRIYKNWFLAIPLEAILNYLGS